MQESTQTAKITREELFPFVHYEYGEAYFASSDGMRARLAREPLQNVHWTPPDKRGPAVLLATWWTGPYAYAATPAEEMTSREFPYSEQGLDEAVAWLNGELDRYLAEKDRTQ